MKLFNNKADNSIDFMRNLALLILTGPFKLCNQLSIKIIYLGRKTIHDVLLGAIILNAILTIAIAVTKIWCKEFSLFIGKAPIIIFLIVLVGLLGLFFYFNIVSLDVYDNVERMFPVKVRIQDTEDKGQPKEPKVNEEPMEVPQEYMQISYKNIKKEFEDFQNELQDRIEANDFGEDNTCHEENLEESSSYFDFKNSTFEESIDTFEDLDLDLGVVPDSFFNILN